LVGVVIPSYERGFLLFEGLDLRRHLPRMYLD